ncbi:MAG: hypothetical protein HOP12_14505 [Candidatus Eisenbacteria bacterium]|uniref:YfhO family protein n=1 Tax=Eiseniibacteriota bacterium TaxID=2212470 RepID=A0A849SIZ5_UNCEI|nr:hypothetical protein [Candidatus Eisenbacteria bacterium]
MNAARRSAAPGALGSIALVALWALLFAPQLFERRPFVVGDTGRYAAYADFSRDRWAELHERTFWNPYVFMGIPAGASLADPRPQWLPAGLLTTWDALDRASRRMPSALPIIASLLGALAAAWLGRVLWIGQAEERVSPVAPPGSEAAGFVAGALWLLAPGLLVPLAFGHDAQSLTLALLPATLLATHGVAAATSRAAVAGCALLLALCVAFEGLAGHPQFLVIVACLAAPFAIERALRFARPRRLRLHVIATLLGLSMSAAVWLPALLYGRHTQRADSGFALREAARWSAAPLDLLALAWPRAAGFGGPGYHGGLAATDYSHSLGLVGALLAVIGLLAARGREARTARWLAALGAIAAVLSLGTGLPPPLRVLLQLPIGSAFRTPVSWLIVTQCCGALLAARGVLECAGGSARWLRPGFPNAGPRALHRVGVAAIGLVATLAALALFAEVRPVLERATGQVASSSASPGFPLRVPPAPALARLAAADPRHRAWPGDPELGFSNDWIAWRAPQIAGLHGAVPSRWDRAAREDLFLCESVLRACAVGWQCGAAGDSIASAPGECRVVAMHAALPRGYSVASVRVLPDDAAVIAAMRDPSWEPERVAFTTESSAGFEGVRSARCEWIRDDPDRLVIRTSASAEAFWVIADTHFPGWRASLDGAEIPIARVNLMLRGVRVPAGTHRLELDYLPQGWTFAVVVARASWLLWFAGVLATRFRRGPARPDRAGRSARTRGSRSREDSPV